jgi:hypothetical protein
MIKRFCDLLNDEETNKDEISRIVKSFPGNVLSYLQYFHYIV